ncbi:MAG: VacJ family lipoprotein [Desulfuromonadales bacterium]|nr:MAG: VacJ family lipoprotein [Desulfuromonadales bacterium]
MNKPGSILMGFLLIIALAAQLSGCATTMANLPPEEPAMHTVAEFADDEKMLFVDDPWIGFNKRMYTFNFYADKYVILPVVRGYEFITPEFAQDGVSNFFNNIGEIKTFYNALLQAKGMKTLNALGRFVTNSTIGIGGLFDVATHMGMQRQPEDFGQTLGVWGVGSGPYVVLPVLGPNTARSTTGLVVDTGARIAMMNAIDPFGNVDNGSTIEAGVTTLEFIDARHQQKFQYYKSHYPFEYFMVRYLYKQQREFAIMK